MLKSTSALRTHMANTDHYVWTLRKAGSQQFIAACKDCFPPDLQNVELLDASECLRCLDIILTGLTKDIYVIELRFDFKSERRLTIPFVHDEGAVNTFVTERSIKESIDYLITALTKISANPSI